MENTMPQARYNMIHQQIRPFEVPDSKVLHILETVNRADYVPEQHHAYAFFDVPTPLDCGQVMLEPKTDAKILQALAVQSSDKILEIGTGSGYLTAGLATLGQHVFSIEIHQTLTAQAQKNLDAQNIKNVTLTTNDALQIWDTEDKYDIIVFTGAVQMIDDTWKSRLKNHGRLFIFAGHPVSEACLITRDDNQYTHTSLFEVYAPPLIEAAVEQEFVF